MCCSRKGCFACVSRFWSEHVASVVLIVDSTKGCCAAHFVGIEHVACVRFDLMFHVWAVQGWFASDRWLLFPWNFYFKGLWTLEQTQNTTKSLRFVLGPKNSNHLSPQLELHCENKTTQAVFVFYNCKRVTPADRASRSTLCAMKGRSTHAFGSRANCFKFSAVAICFGAPNFKCNWQPLFGIRVAGLHQSMSVEVRLSG